MITSIEIENFKGISDRIKIDLRDITLLFGANSAGKSSIIHALHYAREVFVNRNYDADLTEIGGEYVKLGGFRNFVNGRDLDKKVTIRLNATVECFPEHSYIPELSYRQYATQTRLPTNLVKWMDSHQNESKNPSGSMNEWDSCGERTLDLPGGRYDEIWMAEEIKTISVEVTISFDREQKTPHASSYIVEINGMSMGRIDVSPNFRMSYLTHFNLFHPIIPNHFWNLDDLEKFAEEINNMRESPPEAYADASSELFHRGPGAISDILGRMGVVSSQDMKFGEAILELEKHRLQELNNIEKRKIAEFFEQQKRIRESYPRWQSYVQQINDFFAESREGELPRAWDSSAWYGSKDAMPLFSGLNWPFRDLCISEQTPDSGVTDEALEVAEQCHNAYRLYVDYAMTFPGRVLKASLEEGIYYTGSIRQTYAPPKEKSSHIPPHRWATGLGAWDRLAGCSPTEIPYIAHPNSEKQSLNENMLVPDSETDKTSVVSSNEKENQDLVTVVDDWLSNRERLNTGFGMSLSKIYELPSNSEAMRELQDQNAFQSAETVRKILEKIPARNIPTIRSLSTKLEMQPTDVGTGMSQIIPIVVAALDGQNRFNIIEQPELHIHPKLQMSIADMFLFSMKACQHKFLIETHSEHLILRILRRIRETFDHELPPGIQEVFPRDISVCYVESTEKGTKVTPLRITEDGEFADRWPYGFFDERAEELF